MQVKSRSSAMTADVGTRTGTVYSLYGNSIGETGWQMFLFGFKVAVLPNCLHCDPTW